MNRSEEVREALARPRRFLMLMSLAVIAFHALQVGVKPEAEYSGFVLTLARPELAINGLWIVWGWALWRYGQKVYELLSPIWNDVLEDVSAEDLRIALARARKFGDRLAAEGHFKTIAKSARVRERVGTRNPKSEEWDERADRNQITSFHGYFVEKGGGRKYLLKATFDWPDNEGGAVNETFNMVLTSNQTRWVRARAWIHSVLRLPAFNDHIAPIILAMFALASPFLFDQPTPELPDYSTWPRRSS